MSATDLLFAFEQTLHVNGKPTGPQVCFKSLDMAEELPFVIR
jgi:hypothetical protein